MEADNAIWCGRNYTLTDSLVAYFVVTIVIWTYRNVGAVVESNRHDS